MAVDLPTFRGVVFQEQGELEVLLRSVVVAAAAVELRVQVMLVVVMEVTVLF